MTTHVITTQIENLILTVLESIYDDTIIFDEEGGYLIIYKGRHKALMYYSNIVSLANSVRYNKYVYNIAVEIDSIKYSFIEFVEKYSADHESFAPASINIICSHNDLNILLLKVKGLYHCYRRIGVTDGFDPFKL
jgi:hypothetical protein